MADRPHIPSEDTPAPGGTAQQNPDEAGWAHELLEEHRARGFYGELTFKFRGGHIYLSERHETFKPPE